MGMIKLTAKHWGARLFSQASLSCWDTEPQDVQCQATVHASIVWPFSQQLQWHFKWHLWTLEWLRKIFLRRAGLGVDRWASCLSCGCDKNALTKAALGRKGALAHSPSRWGKSRQQGRGSQSYCIHSQKGESNARSHAHAQLTYSFICIPN